MKIKTGTNISLYTLCLHPQRYFVINKLEPDWYKLLFFSRTNWLEELPNLEMFDGTSYDWVGKNMFAYRTCMYSVYYFSSLTAYCYLHVY